MVGLFGAVRQAMLNMLYQSIQTRIDRWGVSMNTKTVLTVPDGVVPVFSIGPLFYREARGRLALSGFLIWEGLCPTLKSV